MGARKEAIKLEDPRIARIARRAIHSNEEGTIGRAIALGSKLTDLLNTKVRLEAAEEPAK